MTHFARIDSNYSATLVVQELPDTLVCLVVHVSSPSFGEIK